MSAGEALTISVEVEGPVRVVRVAGGLDMSTVPLVQACFEARLATEIELVVDLAELSFMDSAGVAALVSIRNRAVEQGWRLTVRSPTGIVANVLRITGVDQYLTIEP